MTGSDSSRLWLVARQINRLVSLLIAVSGAIFNARPLLPRPAPRAERFRYQLEDRPPVVRDHFHPGPPAHLREVDPAKAQTRDEDADAITQRFVMKRVDSPGDGLRAIGAGPPVID